jgi:DNA-nicking Smr family endonuclease
MPKPHPVDIWLRTNEIVDKDSAHPDSQENAHARRSRVKNQKPGAVLDIHGLTRNEAWQALEYFFAESRKKGLEKILVIHGKGNHSTGESILKRTVMEFIELCPYAGESGANKGSAGGTGATWVLLK